jgi:hypothetical protein
MAGLVALAGCAGDTGGADMDDCPNGICVAKGDMAMARPPDFAGVDLFGADLSGSSCTEQWKCTPWDTGGNGNAATRTCTDSAGCGTTNNKPPVTATLPALDLNYYKCNVEPIFDTKCSMMGCHGNETRPLRIYSRGRHRHAGEMIANDQACLQPPGMGPIDHCEGSIECECFADPHTPTEWQRNFDSARSFGLDANLQPIAKGMEATSDLIQQPRVGGKAHTGVHLYRTGDPEDVTLQAWLSGATLNSCNTNN